MKPRAIYVADEEMISLVFGPAERAELAASLDFVAPPFTADALARSSTRFDDVEVIVSSWSPAVMDAAMLDRFPRLRVIFHAAGSVKGLVTDALWRRGVRITSAARANALPVAEFTVSQIVFCLKHGWQRVFEIRAGAEFRREDDTVPGTYAATVGLISLGHSGRVVAERLQAMDVRAIAHDPYVPAALAAELGVELCSLEDIFARSDVISCHTPLLSETSGMLRARHFAAMRPGAAFINTARGGVVNEPEMIEVFGRRPDLFAVLDVTDPEPPAPDSPLRRLANVVLTPHIAGSLGPEYRRVGRFIVDEVARYLANEPLLGEVTPAQIPLIA